ncbi:DNA-binding protein [Mycobacterium sp. E3251]|uniref:Zn-ribbon domain-containing OB-fold protein n=1 Tax=Mycobacterium sp. E3251 TaxID=1834144 RepID=UPI0007FF0201|nr:OB-fold domain-containing protein [Mycobacterium sp. E3251]OBG92380.1 DNA-binding protein [Mycobacterium sp. E3251]
MSIDSTYSRPDFRLAPSPSTESHAFWTGGARGQLMIYRCRACGHFFHPPGPACWRCRSTDVGPEPVSGRATVAAYTVNRQPWIPGLDPPYIVAMVELEDEPDVRLITNVVDVSRDDIHVGLPVEVFFEDWTEPTGDPDSHVWLPLFRPARST